MPREISTVTEGMKLSLVWRLFRAIPLFPVAGVVAEDPHRHVGSTREGIQLRQDPKSHLEGLVYLKVEVDDGV